MADDQQFLGLGWGQSLEILLATSVGERVLNPTFGWKRDALMFEPLSTSFGAYLVRQIETAILFFEPRIDLNSVNFEPEPDQEGLILIRIDYTVRTTNSRTNLVYPFYLARSDNK